MTGRELPAEPLCLDHGAFLTDRRRRRIYIRAIRNASGRRGTAQILHVFHDEECCRQEPWPLTLERLVTAAGAPTMVVWL